MKFTQGKAYKWRVAGTAQRRFHALRHHKGTLEIWGKDGSLYGTVIDSVCTIHIGYEFDGCTCAPDAEDGSILCQLFGNALDGCCWHDLLRQMMDAHPGRLTVQMTDQAMLEVHTERGFQFRNLYYAAVKGPIGRLYSHYIKKR